MKPKPIELAKDADLRGSWPALLRAAAEAKRISQQTGTRLVTVESFGAGDSNVLELDSTLTRRIGFDLLTRTQK